MTLVLSPSLPFRRFLSNKLSDFQAFVYNSDYSIIALTDTAKSAYLYGMQRMQLKVDICMG